MSRYDTLRSELGRIRRSQLVAVAVPTAIVAGVSTLISLQHSTGSFAFCVLVVALFVLPILLHHLYSGTFVSYARMLSRAKEIEPELRSLRQTVDHIYEGYSRREKGQQFKQAFDLRGRSIASLEEALGVGMHFERNEIFVTAFITKGIATRVTASIGSAFKCSAADDPSRWREHVTRLGCEEVRQYHSHPDHNNKTEPSSVDYRTCQRIKELLREHADKLHSFIVYWNEIREWRIIEYDENQKYWLSTALDASTL